MPFKRLAVIDTSIEFFMRPLVNAFPLQGEISVLQGERRPLEELGAAQFVHQPALQEERESAHWHGPFVDLGAAAVGEDNSR